MCNFAGQTTMKKLILILTLIALNVHGQQQTKFKVDTVKHLDEKNQPWRIFVRKKDNNNNFVEVVQKIKENKKFVNSYKSSFLYDNKNRQVERFDQSWENNAWVNSYKLNYEYTQLGDTLIRSYEWKNNKWWTEAEFAKAFPHLVEKEKEPYDPGKIEYFIFTISHKQIIPMDENVKMEHNYEKDHRVVGWKNNLNTRQKRINELVKLGFELYSVNAEDNEKGSLVFVNCKENYVCTLTIWYRYHLSIALEWFDDSIKNSITYLKSCPK